MSELLGAVAYLISLSAFCLVWCVVRGVIIDVRAMRARRAGATMSAKHASRIYRNNATLIRKQVQAAHRLGEPVACWRGRGVILPGQPFDIGHINRFGGEGLGNLAPEHRHRQPGCCDGNRRDGGRVGAHANNARHRRDETQTWKL